MSVAGKKFSKKPVVIEAHQWQPAFGVWDLPDWLLEAVKKGKVSRNPESHDQLLIETLEGVMTAQPGDWIIRGAKGELYPCKPDIFEATYDPVDPGWTS